jgi:hypothetical protein
MIFSCNSFRYLIHTAFVPRVAFQKPPYNQIAAPKKTMFLDSLQPIIRASGIKPTALPHERANTKLIQPNE